MSTGQEGGTAPRQVREKTVLESNLETLGVKPWDPDEMTYDQWEMESLKFLLRTNR